MSRYITWLICALLSLGLMPGQLTRVLRSPSTNPNQSTQPRGHSEDEHDHAQEESLKGVCQRVSSGGPGPTRGWLVLREASTVHPREPALLAPEDVRRVFLPRRSPPPEPDSHLHA